MNVTGLINQLHEFNPWAEILVGHLNRKGIQQKQLAKMIYVEPATVNQWCKGKCLPKGDMVYDLIEALELSGDQVNTFIDSWLEVQRIRDLIPMLEAAAERQNFGVFKRLYFELASLIFTFLNVS